MSIDQFAVARRFVESLRMSDRLPTNNRQPYEAPLLERLCRHAALNTAFNRDRLAPLFEMGDARNGKFLAGNWMKIPVLRRPEAQARNNELHAAQTPDAAGSSRRLQTSGSSGRPLEFNRSQLSDAAGLALFERMLEWHRIDSSARLCWIRIGEGEVEGRGWSLAHPEAERFELSKSISSDKTLQWLAERRPRYVIAPPSVVDGLVQEARRAEFRVEIEAFLITSETPVEGLEAGAREMFGARLVDSYGTREIGPIAVDCPDCAGVKHVPSETIKVEIVTRDGRIAEPGETGAVVVTPYFNYGTPLVRYDVGDLAVQGDGPCSCGRTLPALKAILGRQNQLFVRRDGSRFMAKGRKPASALLSAAQIQFVQKDFERIEIRYAKLSHDAPEDRRTTIEELRKIFGPDLAVDFVLVDEIPLGPGGKFADFLCEVDANGT